MPIFSTRCAAHGLILFMPSLVFADQLQAAQLTVNTLDDVVINDGQCSLREAIEAANTDADFSDCVGDGAYGSDRIEFSVAGTIAISPELDITDSLTIDGTNQIALDGGDTNRIFSGQGEGLELRLSGLEMINGFDEQSTGGGCIRMFGSGVLLEIQDSRFQFCRVINTGISASFGGAITIGRSPGIEPLQTADPGNRGGQQPSRLDIARTAFLNNRAESDLNQAAGGAIQAGPDPMEIRIEDARFLANFAQSFDPRGRPAAGGGLFVDEAINLFINRTEWSFNGAVSTASDSFGGGISIETQTGPALIQNSTISQNQAFSAGTDSEARGGGLYARITSQDDVLSLNNNTIVRNRTRAGSGAQARSGGIEIAAGLSNLANTILANNVAVDESDPDNPVPSDCLPDSLLQSLGYNLIKTNCGLSAAPGDQFGVDPMLDELAENGGPIEGMLSHLPRVNSPALDAGNPAPVQQFQPVGEVRACQPVDQRLLPRPVDAIGGPICDVGAIEVQGGQIEPAVPVPGFSRWGLIVLTIMLLLVLIGHQRKDDWQRTRQS